MHRATVEEMLHSTRHLKFEKEGLVGYCPNPVYTQYQN